MKQKKTTNKCILFVSSIIIFLPAVRILGLIYVFFCLFFWQGGGRENLISTQSET